MLSSRGHRPNFWSSGGLRTTRKSAMKKTQHVHWRPRPSFHQEKQDRTPSRVPGLRGIYSCKKRIASFSRSSHLTRLIVAHNLWWDAEMEGRVHRSGEKDGKNLCPFPRRDVLCP